MNGDVMAWAHEKSGMYSVRSAYRLLKVEMSRKVMKKTGGGATSTRGIWWKSLSKLKIPPKIRIFWWCVINGFLPCKAELKRRHLREEGHCDACGNTVEDLYHVLVNCPWARRFWSTVKEILGRKLPRLHPRSWTTDLLCSRQDAAIFVCGCCSL